MASHRCKTQCFYGGNLYEVGDEAQFNPGEKVPEHFERIDGEEEAGDGKQSGKGKTKPDAGA